MQLQKAPLGILGWFALKVLGRNPPAFADAVTPTVDVGDNYLLASEWNAQVATGSMALGATISTLMSFTVPAGKIWRVQAISADITLNAADIAKYVGASCYLVPGGTTGLETYLLAQENLLNSWIIHNAVQLFHRPLLLPPASRLVFFWQSSAALAAAASSVHASVLRNEIDI